MNVVGLVISLIGIVGYNILRISESKGSVKERPSSIELYSAVEDEEDDADLEDRISLDDDNHDDTNFKHAQM